MTTWAEIEALITDRWSGRRRYRSGSSRGYDVPSPTGGTLLVIVALRPRWCSLTVDRWRTTDRALKPSKTWFETNVWPRVRTACEKKRTGSGWMPSGGGNHAGAHPIDRADLRDLLVAWVDAELTWGQPKDAPK